MNKKYTILKDASLPFEVDGTFYDNNQKYDVIVDHRSGRIKEIGRFSKSDIQEESFKVIKCRGHLLTPSFVDLHVHFRTPGQENKEDLKSGTNAALAGGFTTVACMPNTTPTIDNAFVLEKLLASAGKQSSIDIKSYAAITYGLKGERLTNFEELKESGALGFTDDGRGIQSEEMMELCMKEAKRLKLPILAHCEDERHSKGAPLHQGIKSHSWNMPGQSCEAEYSHVKRDIELVKKIGTQYHVCHMSCAESMRMIRKAKKQGLPVSSEVTPHHLLISHDEIPNLDTDFKMNPPLRDKEDLLAMVEGIKDGTIDFIATDHAPHTQKEKKQNMHCAPFGVVGLETAFPLLYTKLVLTNLLNLSDLIALMSTKPARYFGLNEGTLKTGSFANLALIDLQTSQQVDPNKFFSKGKNTPFKDWKLKGYPIMTMKKGKVLYQTEELTCE